MLNHSQFCFFLNFRKEVGQCRTKSFSPSYSTVISALSLASPMPSNCYRATCTCCQNLKRWHKSWSPKGCFCREDTYLLHIHIHRYTHTYQINADENKKNCSQDETSKIPVSHPFGGTLPQPGSSRSQEKKRKYH